MPYVATSRPGHPSDEVVVNLKQTQKTKSLVVDMGYSNLYITSAFENNKLGIGVKKNKNVKKYQTQNVLLQNAFLCRQAIEKITIFSPGHQIIQEFREIHQDQVNPANRDERN